MIIIVSHEKISARAPSAALSALWLLILFLLCYFLKNPSLAAASARTALEICAVGLIPSLFVFMVLVSLINASGFSTYASRLIGRPISFIFGIGENAATAVLLGALGGFPIGAACARSLYERGELSRDDGARLITFTNNASPAFCIGTIGTVLFCDVGFGVRLYFSQIFAAVIIGIAQRSRRKTERSGTIVPQIKSVSDVFTEAVSGAGITMLKICSFAVFFAVVGDALCKTVSHYFGSYSAAVCSAICELTLAARGCSALGSNAARLICAFAVGFSGVSVHMQVASVLSGTGISMKRYYICKLFQGVLSVCILCSVNML